MTPRTLVMALEATARAVAGKLPPEALLFVPDPTVGGAFSELRDGREVIRFGYRPEGRFRWLRIFDVPPTGHNVATQAIERIVFARRISDVVVLDIELLPIAVRGVAAHPGVKLHPPSEYR